MALSAAGGGPDRTALHDLCRRALGFKNHVLTRYRTFLLEELHRPEEAVQPAVQRLGPVYDRYAEKREVEQ